jgi:Uma2 family endonuclease
MAATTLLTSDQFLALPGECDRVVHQELINGEVVSMPHAAKRHDIIRSNILDALFVYLRSNKGLGLKAPPDTEFVVSANDTFIPDAYLRIKTEAYLTHGSRSVWIVFPEVRTVAVYTSDSVAEFKADQAITDPLLPGFCSPVAVFFELT